MGCCEWRVSLQRSGGGWAEPGACVPRCRGAGCGRLTVCRTSRFLGPLRGARWRGRRGTRGRRPGFCALSRGLGDPVLSKRALRGRAGQLVLGWCPCCWGAQCPGACWRAGGPMPRGDTGLSRSGSGGQARGPPVCSGRPGGPGRRGLPAPWGAALGALPAGLRGMRPPSGSGQAGLRDPVLPRRVPGSCPPGVLGDAHGPVHTGPTLSRTVLCLWVLAGRWRGAGVHGHLSLVAAAPAAPRPCAAGPSGGGRVPAGQQVSGADGGS